MWGPVNGGLQLGGGGYQVLHDGGGVATAALRLPEELAGKA